MWICRPRPAGRKKAFHDNKSAKDCSIHKFLTYRRPNGLNLSRARAAARYYSENATLQLGRPVSIDLLGGAVAGQLCGVPALASSIPWEDTIGKRADSYSHGQEGEGLEIRLPKG